MSYIICNSEDKPPRELRRAGQVVYETDVAKYVMWDGQEWVEVEGQPGQWHRVERTDRRL